MLKALEALPELGEKPEVHEVAIIIFKPGAWAHKIVDGHSDAGIRLQTLYAQEGVDRSTELRASVLGTTPIPMGGEGTGLAYFVARDPQEDRTSRYWVTHVDQIWDYKSLKTD